LHAESVIDSNQDLVVTLGWKGPAQPDLVVTVVRRDERDHLLHVESFSRFEIALQVLGLLRLEHDAQLLAKTGGYLLCLVLELSKQFQRASM